MKVDAFGIILCFFIVIAIESLYIIGGGYGPSVKDRGNMAATQEDVSEVLGTTFKVLNGDFK